MRPTDGNMKLRSGRILKPIREKTRKAKVNQLSKLFQTITSNDSQVDKILQDLKRVFEFIILDICERLTVRIRLENNRPKDEQRSHGSLHESFDERFFKTYWQETHTRLMQLYSPHQLLEICPFIMVQEYQINQHDLQYMYIELRLTRYVTDFYETLNATRVFERCDEKRRSRTRFTSKGYGLYLECLARKIAMAAFNSFFPIRIQLSGYVPPFRKPYIPWEQIVKDVKNNCCYIPKNDGGCTVVKQMSGLFSFAHYEYIILDTNIKFKSIESNVKKAYFLHAKCSPQNQNIDCLL